MQTRNIAGLLFMSLYLFVDAYACGTGTSPDGPCSDDVAAGVANAYCANVKPCGFGTHSECQGVAANTPGDDGTCKATCSNCQCPNDGIPGGPSDPAQTQGNGF